MRKIRVLGVLTHFKLKKDSQGKEYLINGGVDYVRVIQPLMNLPKDKFDVDIEYEPVKENGRFKTVEELTKYYDICYFSYIDTVQFYIQLRVLGIKNGMKMILDLDDNIWNVDPSHPNYKGDFEPGSKSNFERSAIIIDVDGITSTGRYLKYEINRYTRRKLEDIAIMPNFIDLNQYDYKKIPQVKNKEITIGYMGGSSHFPDVNKPEFTKAMNIIMDKYPNVRFKTTFYMPQLKAMWGYKYKYTLGRHNIYRFINEVWTQMSAECDIFVAPLSWSNYSRAKSYVKALEYGASKRPFILENIDPYKDFAGVDPESHGVYMANTTDEWVKHLSELIESEAKRKEMGEKAYNYVKDNFTIQKNAKLYSDYFSSIIDKSNLKP